MPIGRPKRRQLSAGQPLHARVHRLIPIDEAVRHDSPAISDDLDERDAQIQRDVAEIRLVEGGVGVVADGLE